MYILLSQTKPDPRCVQVCSRVSIFVINWEQFTNARIHLLYKAPVLFQELMKNQEWKYKTQQNVLVCSSVFSRFAYLWKKYCSRFLAHLWSCLYKLAEYYAGVQICLHIAFINPIYISWYGAYYDPFLKKMVRVLCLWLEEWDGGCHGTIQAGV
jgi:hypothetical protein